MVSAPNVGCNQQLNRRNRRNRVNRQRRMRSYWKGRIRCDGGFVKVALTFILTRPTKWHDILVQLGKGWPRECLTAVVDSKVCCDLIRLDWREPVNPGLLKWVCGNRFVELPITCIRSINWLKGNEFERIRGQIRSMFLLLTTWYLAVLEFIGSTFEGRSYAPRSCKCKLKLVNNLSSRMRPDCPASKDDVANRINLQVRAARITVFAMISMLLLNEQFCNFAAG